jgi:hypothetical protein
VEYELIEEEAISGPKLKIYSLVPLGKDHSLYESFFIEYIGQFPDEIQDIDDRLRIMGNETGLRDHFYTPNEGNPGDGVCTLFDKPEKNLRLYFILYGKVAIILGGGGPKSKTIRALQEDPKLKKENYLLRNISLCIKQSIQEKNLRLDEDGFWAEDDDAWILSV